MPIWGGAGPWGAGARGGAEGLRHPAHPRSASGTARSTSCRTALLLADSYHVSRYNTNTGTADGRDVRGGGALRSCADRGPGRLAAATPCPPPRAPVGGGDRVSQSASRAARVGLDRLGILSILLHAVKWLLILALLMSLAVVISGAITTGPLKSGNSAGAGKKNRAFCPGFSVTQRWRLLLPGAADHERRARPPPRPLPPSR